MEALGPKPELQENERVMLVFARKMTARKGKTLFQTVHRAVGTARLSENVVHNDLQTHDAVKPPAC